MTKSKNKRKLQWFLGKKREKYLSTNRPDTTYEVFSYTKIEYDEDHDWSGDEPENLEEELDSVFDATYKHIIGPFKSEDAAKYMRDHSDCRSVEEAERGAKEQWRNYCGGR